MDCEIIQSIISISIIAWIRLITRIGSTLGSLGLLNQFQLLLWKLLFQVVDLVFDQFLTPQSGWIAEFMLVLCFLAALISVVSSIDKLRRSCNLAEVTEVLLTGGTWLAVSISAHLCSASKFTTFWFSVLVTWSAVSVSAKPWSASKFTTFWLPLFSIVFFFLSDGTPWNRFLRCSGTYLQPLYITAILRCSGTYMLPFCITRFLRCEDGT